MSEDHSNPNRAADSKLEKVRFVLSADDRTHGVEAETLWVESLGHERFRIDNVPFYVYGVSVGDIVTAEVEDGRLVFRSIAVRGGHSTYRVLVKDEQGFEADSFRTLWSQLEKLGCSYEVAKRRWIAIDVPPSTDVVAVYRILEAGERREVWTFEEGHCGHPVSE